ncbi:hypothetical protein RRG08_023337 [Elysia crispata]|uniref:Uncharacterized protein n=1 Tax=Elysia crispata TaxID=231223 RepID=A0AAE1BDP5_9GAST|nr:hypothetical protein RRG08_023337 [Elysia crispata]
MCHGYLVLMPGYVVLMSGFVVLMSSFVVLMSGYVKLISGYVILMSSIVVLMPGAMVLMPGSGALMPGYVALMPGSVALMSYSENLSEDLGFGRDGILELALRVLTDFSAESQLIQDKSLGLIVCNLGRARQALRQSDDFHLPHVSLRALLSCYQFSGLWLSFLIVFL